MNRADGSHNLGSFLKNCLPNPSTQVEPLASVKVRSRPLLKLAPQRDSQVTVNLGIKRCTRNKEIV
jgi:hypothetical protein